MDQKFAQVNEVEHWSSMLIMSLTNPSFVISDNR